MTLLLGIDLGTTRIKALIIDAETAQPLGQASREIAINIPHPAYAEQNPEDWWQATTACVHEAINNSDIDPQHITGIGLSGQMHGTVCLNDQLDVMRPAIIWADRRSADYVDEIMEAVDADDLAHHAPGIPAAGYMALTLMWLRDHESQTYRHSHRVLFPKDYLRLRLTGEVGAERSDGSAGWLIDVHTGEWSEWLIDLCGLDAEILPPLSDSWDEIGSLTLPASEALGLPTGIPVAAGAADMAAQALGHGLIDPGQTLLIVGTGGQVFAPLTQPEAPASEGTYIYRHAAPDRWYVQSAILAGGLALQWLRDMLGIGARPDAFAYLSSLAADIPPGADGLTIIPHLAGTRRIAGAQDSASIIGLRLHHTPGHLARAMMEGVAFAMRDCLDHSRQISGGETGQIIMSGGAMTSPVLRQIMADVLGQPLHVHTGNHHAALGAALLGGVAAGIYESLEDAFSRLAGPDLTIECSPTRHALYQAHYQTYQILTKTIRSE